MWIKKLLYDIQIPIPKITVIGTDSKNALIAAESDQRNMSTRHTDVGYKWVKEKIKNGELTLDWVETGKMKADGRPYKAAEPHEASTLRPAHRPERSNYDYERAGKGNTKRGTN